MNCHDATAAEFQHAAQKSIALAGNPNVGKSTLFNILTGGKQRIANYPGVTVEKKTGFLKSKNGESIQVIDLPGAYSLNANSEDEVIAANCILGNLSDVPKPDIVLVVIEAAHLDRGLLLFKQIQALHPQPVLILNMMDELKAENLQIDTQKLSRLIGAPVVAATAKRNLGIAEILATIERTPVLSPQEKAKKLNLVQSDLTTEKFTEIDALVAQVLQKKSSPRNHLTAQLDAVFLHSIFGPLVFLLVMFFVFQSLFTWAAPLMDAIDSGRNVLSGVVTDRIMTPWLKSLLADGVIAGVGSVLVFVPQIAITFVLIGFLEMTGYLARGAFLMDRLMRVVGLEGRAFIPLMSSFACAIPGIMAARTIPNTRQRLMTILIAPLMTCSARLPVYTLLIATFIPAKMIFGVVNAQGLALFALFFLGIFAGLFVAWLLNRFLPNKSTGGFFIELPKYRLPTFRNLYYYTTFRTSAFLKTAGTTIFLLSVILWALAYFPHSQSIAKNFDSQISAVTLSTLSDAEKAETTQALQNEKSGEMLRASFMGQLGHVMTPLIQPMGYDWRLGIGILASFAAREVFVSTLGIVFNLGQADENSPGLRTLLQSAQTPDHRPAYTLATALSLLVFFALAAQCMSTLAVIRRETNSYTWPAFVFIYMSLLAFAGATLTYQISTHFFTT